MTVHKVTPVFDSSKSLKTLHPGGKFFPDPFDLIYHCIRRFTFHPHEKIISSELLPG